MTEPLWPSKAGSMVPGGAQAELILSLIWEDKSSYWDRVLRALQGGFPEVQKGFALTFDALGNLRVMAKLGLSPSEQAFLDGLPAPEWHRIPIVEEAFRPGRVRPRLYALGSEALMALGRLWDPRTAALVTVIPLRGGDRNLGLLVLLSREADLDPKVLESLGTLVETTSRLWIRLTHGPEAEGHQQDLELLYFLTKSQLEPMDGDLSSFLQEGLPLVGADFATLFRLDEEDLVTEVVVGQPASFRGLRFPVGQGLAGEAAQTGEMVVVTDSLTDARIGKESFLKAGGPTASLTIPLFRHQQILGVLGLGRRGAHPFGPEETARAKLLAQAVQSRLLRDTETREERAHNASLVRSLSQVVDARDPYTGQHSESVTRYTRLIARQMHLDGKVIDDLTVAALLHDLGKLGIPDSLWTKNSPPTQEELLLMRSHPALGASILDRGPDRLARVADLVRYHHERWDGQGYPNGLRGPDIPLGASILAVADAFDAMLSPRPYRRSLNRREALSELGKNSGSQFRPDVVQALEQSLAEEDTEPEVELQALTPIPVRVFGTLEILKQLSERLDQLLTDPDALLRETLGSVRENLLADSGIILRTDSRTQGPLAVIGEWVSGEPPCWARSKAACHLILDRPGRLADLARECPEAPGPGSELVAPLRHRENLLGWMILRRNQPFNFQEAQLLSDLSDYLARALSVAMNYEEMVEESTHDYLTGVLTRRSLFERFREELSRAQRHERPLTVAITDLDHLKEINDTYGHQTGDEALIDFCERLQLSLRQEDALGRYGGDEFVVLFPETSLDGAERSLQRTLDRFRRDARIRQHGIAPSFSWGLAIFPDDGATVEEILAVADRRLYQQKDRPTASFRSAVGGSRSSEN